MGEGTGVILTDGLAITSQSGLLVHTHKKIGQHSGQLQPDSSQVSVQEVKVKIGRPFLVANKNMQLS